MSIRTLEVSSYDGKLVAGYLTLPQNSGEKSVHTTEPEPGIVVDFAADGRALGIEFYTPSVVTLDAVNRVLESLNQPVATAQELALLFAARASVAHAS